MGANEIPNNFHAALQHNGVDTIISSSGIRRVTRTGTGTFEVELVNPIGAAEVSADTAIVSVTTFGFLSATRVSETEWLVVAKNAVGALVDRQFCFNLFRLPTVS